MFLFIYINVADITALIDHQEVHLILQTNPDGRKKAETGLSWRKNTNSGHCTNSNSRGIDLNRNFPFKWGGAGSSGNQCDNTYRGPSPHSEPETEAGLDYMKTIFPPNQRCVNPNCDNLADDDPAPDNAMGVAIDIHSYGELVLSPWGFTANDQCGNHNQFVTFGRKPAYFNGYEPKVSAGLYVTTGSTEDTYYADFGVAAFVYELGTSFFQSCSVFESEIFPDNVKSLMYAAMVSRTPYKTVRRIPLPVLNELQ